jgi:AcrR family transcriptional regulator
MNTKQPLTVRDVARIADVAPQALYSAIGKGADITDEDLLRWAQARIARGLELVGSGQRVIKAIEEA